MMFGWFQSKKVVINHEPSTPDPTEKFEDPSAILELFTSRTGIHFQQKEAITLSKLISFCRNHAIYSFDEFYHRLLNEPILFEELINSLTVNETYFFREMGQIDFLCKRFSHDSKPIRILCAPGSTGEEPYTIAISLIEKGIPPERIEIISIDINSEATAKAISGIYSQRALHKVSDLIKEQYFDRVDDRYQIKEKIKSLVHFHHINLFDDAILKLGTFDAIFSRNMLIYFDLETVQRAISRLCKLANQSRCYFFFGHADIVHPPKELHENYEENIRFFTL